MSNQSRTDADGEITTTTLDCAGRIVASWYKPGRVDFPVPWRPCKDGQVAAFHAQVEGEKILAPVLETAFGHVVGETAEERRFVQTRPPYSVLSQRNRGNCIPHDAGCATLTLSLTDRPFRPRRRPHMWQEGCDRQKTD